MGNGSVKDETGAMYWVEEGRSKLVPRPGGRGGLCWAASLRMAARNRQQALCTCSVAVKHHAGRSLPRTGTVQHNSNGQGQHGEPAWRKGRVRFAGHAVVTDSDSL